MAPDHRLEKAVLQAMRQARRPLKYTELRRSVRMADVNIPPHGLENALDRLLTSGQIEIVTRTPSTTYQLARDRTK